MYRDPITRDTIVTLPCWALSAIFNDDYSGLNPQEEEQVREFMAAWPGAIFGIDHDERWSFSRTPEFGLPCDCVDTRVWVPARYQHHYA